MILSINPTYYFYRKVYNYGKIEGNKSMLLYPSNKIPRDNMRNLDIDGS